MYNICVNNDLQALAQSSARKSFPEKQRAQKMPDGSFKIPAQNRGKPPAHGFITDFKTVAESPKAKQIGTIKDIKRFKTPLNNGASTNVDLPIKAHGTDVIIPQEYEQFLPEIEEMIYQCSLNANNSSVYMLTVRQGITKADEDCAGYAGIHKDLNLNRVTDGGAPNSLVMVASDCLTTGFSTFQLSENDITEIERSENPNKKMDEIIARSNLDMYSFPAGSITAHDANVIHALAKPEKDTPRTAIIIAVHPEGEPIQALDLNPSLAKEIEATQPNPTSPSRDRRP